MRCEGASVPSFCRLACSLPDLETPAASSEPKNRQGLGPTYFKFGRLLPNGDDRFHRCTSHGKVVVGKQRIPDAGMRGAYFQLQLPEAGDALICEDGGFYYFHCRVTEMPPSIVLAPRECSESRWVFPQEVLQLGPIMELSRLPRSYMKTSIKHQAPTRCQGCPRNTVSRLRWNPVERGAARCIAYGGKG